jgi:hypothetical protein
MSENEVYSIKGYYVGKEFVKQGTVQKGDNAGTEFKIFKVSIKRDMNDQYPVRINCPTFINGSDYLTDDNQGNQFMFKYRLSPPMYNAKAGKEIQYKNMVAISSDLNEEENLDPNLSGKGQGQATTQSKPVTAESYQDKRNAQTGEIEATEQEYAFIQSYTKAMGDKGKMADVSYQHFIGTYAWNMKQNLSYDYIKRLRELCDAYITKPDTYKAEKQKSVEV